MQKCVSNTAGTMTHGMTIKLDELLSKADFLQRARNGDRSSLEKLARAILPRVRKTIFFTMGSNNESEDVVQVAMVRIFRGLSQFRGDAQLETWIDRVTVNAVRAHFRRHPFRSLFLSPDSGEQMVAPGDTPQDEAEKRELMERLREHLTHIKPKKRIALVLSAAYGYTVSEIAQMTDCSTETAKKRLQHGRSEMMRRLSKDEPLSKILEASAPCQD